ncbi:hypothetical protein C8N43_0068 [Litoreibacter ponti]|uniref:Sulphur transport domain-containing protein n=1 Tax=Litoreibacter ponti TaxID=1510457 RepID=A0A2T6BHA0_9RHOB|nr:DUF6691 family protein [Litoreibacter ponti]PTX55434.1 hypothetical protein C8N43_0068 [Litoreibacter ponti]
MRVLVSLLAGGLFGAGLLVSGMTDTRKVIGWLDIFGAWDPTLAFVMGGAIIPMFFAWRLAEARGTAPARPETRLSPDLIAGSVLFGAGWGLAGLCPGPAVASLSFGGWNGALFFASMCAGMAALPPVRKLWTGPPAHSI